MRWPPIFDENSYYYVLGYETPKRGDQLRRIEVKVNRPDVTVRTRSFWKPPKELRADAPPGMRAEHSLSSIVPTTDVPMRVTVAPFAAQIIVWRFQRRRWRVASIS